MINNLGVSYGSVFTEASRVLKPGGLIYIIEPIADGSSQHVMELFHDETAVCAAAQEAMTQFLPGHFEYHSSNQYEVHRHNVDFEAYFKHYGNLSYNQYQAESVSSDAVKQRFYLIRIKMEASRSSSRSSQINLHCVAEFTDGIKTIYSLYCQEKTSSMRFTAPQ